MNETMNSHIVFIIIIYSFLTTFTFRLGGPGVDAHVRHEAGEAVLHAKFLINEGALVTATADDQLHLWTFRQKLPQRVQSLKFQRE
ncbi:hypothetical protein ABMA28_002466, partial [Loxostege sticticalis]